MLDPARANHLASSKVEHARPRGCPILPQAPLSGGLSCFGNSALMSRQILPAVLRGPSFVVLVADVGDIDPRVPHFVDGPVTKTNPLVRIGVVGISRRVVVPRSDMDHRALRKGRRGVL